MHCLFFSEVYLTYLREYIKWWIAQKFAFKWGKFNSRVLYYLENSQKED